MSLIHEYNESNKVNHSDELNFVNDNPGASKYGNFINYYQFNGAEKRLQKLQTDLLRFDNVNNLLCLDIGCNTGELTSELYEIIDSINNPLQKTKFLAIDIDPILIKRAEELNIQETIEYKCLDIMESKCQEEFLQYLTENNATHFNVICAFSVTMWIHLNHGDEGLVRFLKILCKNADMIVIEPQPWKCYRKALRRIKRGNSDFPLFSTLKITENVVDFIRKCIETNGFGMVYQSDETDWGRCVWYFKKL